MFETFYVSISPDIWNHNLNTLKPYIQFLLGFTQSVSYILLFCLAILCLLDVCELYNVFLFKSNIDHLDQHGFSIWIPIIKFQWKRFGAKSFRRWKSLCVYLCVHVCVCETHIHVCVWHTHPDIYVCICARMCVYVHVCMYTHRILLHTSLKKLNHFFTTHSPTITLFSSYYLPFECVKSTFVHLMQSL